MGPNFLLFNSFCKQLQHDKYVQSLICMNATIFNIFCQLLKSMKIQYIQIEKLNLKCVARKNSSKWKQLLSICKNRNCIFTFVFYFFFGFFYAQIDIFIMIDMVMLSTVFNDGSACTDSFGYSLPGFQTCQNVRLGATKKLVLRQNAQFFTALKLHSLLYSCAITSKGQHKKKILFVMVSLLNTRSTISLWFNNKYSGKKIEKQFIPRNT